MSAPAPQPQVTCNIREGTRQVASRATVGGSNMRAFLCLMTAALAGMGSAQSAVAQAYTQAKGHGRVITTAIYAHSSKGFDDNGRVIDINTYEQTQVYAAAEYGLTEDLTLLLTPSFRNVNIDGGDDSTGLGYTDIGARYRLVNSNGFVLSGQGIVRIPGVKQRNNFAQVGNTDAEYDLRLQGAKSFKFAGLSSFVILETGYRLRSGQPQNEVHLDGTLGIDVVPRTRLFISSYNTLSDGRGNGIFNQHYRYDDIFLSGTYDVSRVLTLQLGVQGTISGQNALRQRGGFAGIWVRF